MAVIYGKSGPEVSKKGNCIAEWQVQKLNVPPREKHRGRNIGALFPVQTWRHLMKPAGDKKEKEKSQMSSIVKNAPKKIESPAPGYCGSHMCSWGCCECVYVWASRTGTTPAPNDWCLREWVGESTVLCLLSWSTPKQLFWVTVGDGTLDQPFSLTSESHSCALLFLSCSSEELRHTGRGCMRVFYIHSLNIRPLFPRLSTTPCQ